MGSADKTPTEESPYAVVDCESSVTALEMVQVPLDKQGRHHWVGRKRKRGGGGKTRGGGRREVRGGEGGASASFR